MNAHPILFAPLRIGGRTVKNRIVSSAHGEMLAEGGIITDHLIRYHARRAEGGTGMIIAFGSATVHPEATSAGNVALWDERNDAALARLAREVHAHGCIILAQASHRATREALANLDDVLQAPSLPTGALKQSYYGAPHVLTITEIEEIIENYATAAERLVRAGFDGIELTALGSHLMEQFWSPTLNRRTDRYGGNFEGRLRFTLEVLDRVHKAVPEGFIIAFRLSADLFTDRLGLAFDDILAIAQRLDATGQVHLFDISGGSGFDTSTHAAAVPTDTFAERTYTATSRRFREALKAPVLVAGRILNADSAEFVLSNGDSDLVALTRALIADPDLPQRVAKRETARVRPCIAINEGCRRVTIGRSLACAVNAGVADPALIDFTPAERKRKVTIVGAGPAGMEAARVCAERGHSVELYDSQERLGGQMHAFSRLARWPHLLGHVTWLEAELARLNVKVSRNRTIDAATLLQQDVDDIVIATGAASALPPEAQPIEGWSIRDTDLLETEREAPAGKSVAVYDVEGRLRGARSALLAKECGATNVTLVVPHDIACENLEPPNRPAIYRDLADAGIEIVAHSHLIDQETPGLRVRDSWSDRPATIPCDLAIFAGYRRAVSELAEELLAAGPTARIHLVGDCRAPRLLRNAVSEGTRIGYQI